MAYWADTDTLVSYLRHSFITCDETGVCEAVLEPPQRIPKPGALRIPRTGEHPALDSDEEEAEWMGREETESPDVAVESEGYRRRSNTAIQLELHREERKRAAQVKRIRWRQPSLNLPPQQLATLFPLQEPPTRTDEDKTSLVSKLIEESNSGPGNPFQDFARFQATTGQGCKKFCLLVPKSGDGSLRLSVVSTARVRDLVGLALWLYTAQERQPPIQGTVDDFILRMAEESGEIEEDLPPLNSTEVVGRVGFPVLALVKSGRSKASKTAAARKLTVTVYTGLGETLEVEVEKVDVTLREIRDRALRARKVLPRCEETLVEYVLERVSEAGEALDLDSSLSAALTTQFVLLRAHTARGPQVQALIGGGRARGSVSHSASAAPNLPDTMLAPICHFYRVDLLSKPKLKTRSKVQLVVCGDRVEVVVEAGAETERKNSTGTIKFFRSPARFVRPRLNSSVTSIELSIERLGDVQVLEENQGESKFRIYYLADDGTEWKPLNFAAPTDIANKILSTLREYLISAADARLSYQSRVARKPSLLRRLSSLTSRY